MRDNIQKWFIENHIVNSDCIIDWFDAHTAWPRLCVRKMHKQLQEYMVLTSIIYDFAKQPYVLFVSSIVGC